ncbi:MAG: hypothetical protein P1U56_07080 [Saprospiraceae bacterium]|nr:hypothetical protein [Saprospiraceae bacterium]
MKYSNFFIFILLMVCVLSCKTSEVTSPSEYIGQRLNMKHGGGFAGTYTSYHLLDNGQLFKASKSLDSIFGVKRMDKKIAKQIFSNYDVLGLKDQKMETYGNLTYYIEHVDKEGMKHKLTWEKGQEGAEQMQMFYDNVMSHIRKNHEVNKEQSTSTPKQ